jgi:hypothetical protein
MIKVVQSRAYVGWESRGEGSHTSESGVSHYNKVRLQAFAANSNLSIEDNPISVALIVAADALAVAGVFCQRIGALDLHTRTIG